MIYLNSGVCLLSKERNPSYCPSIIFIL